MPRSQDWQAGGVPGVAQDLALNAARGMRAEANAGMAAPPMERPRRAAGAPRWLALAGASLVCAILAARRGSHVEITMLAIAVASLVYGVYVLVHKPMVIRRQHVALDFAMGLLGGVTGAPRISRARPSQ